MSDKSRDFVWNICDSLPKRKHGKSFIYGLFDPDTDAIRYVGKSDDVRNRYKSHFNEANQRPQTSKQRWLCELRQQGKFAVMKILEECDYTQSSQLEIFWIRACMDDGAYLLNTL